MFLPAVILSLLVLLFPDKVLGSLPALGNSENTET